MPWTENRRVKLTVMNKSPRKQQNVSVEFEVANEKRESFRSSLEYLLAACQTAEGIFEFEDVVDGESHQVAGLEIKIIGNQQRLQEIIQQHIPNLQSNCVWIR